jgi:NFACT protein RNA binding domain
MLCRFHVDKLSSAHVYLRLPHGKTLDDIPEDLLEECCQLVKQNSIQGCKENNIDIVYTKWNNLRKTADMVVGQVSFHKQKEVRKYKVEKTKNDILNRIKKTKTESFPDLATQREQYDREMSYVRKQELQVRRVEACVRPTGAALLQRLVKHTHHASLAHTAVTCFQQQHCRV